MRSARDFSKIGIVRCRELDFYDDGTRFTGYTYGPLKITYAYYNGEIFFSVRLDYDNDVSYCDYERTCDWVRKCDKYNGVDIVTVDIWEMKKDLDEIVTNLMTLKESVNNLEVDITPYLSQRIKERKEIEKIIDTVKRTYDWTTASDSNLCLIKNCLAWLKQTARELEKPLDINTIPKKYLRLWMYNLNKNKYVCLNRDNYYIKKLKELGAYVEEA